MLCIMAIMSEVSHADWTELFYSTASHKPRYYTSRCAEIAAQGANFTTYTDSISAGTDRFKGQPGDS